MTAPTFKKASDATVDPTNVRYGAPDLKYALDVLDGSHATDRVQVANIEGAASAGNTMTFTGKTMSATNNTFSNLIGYPDISPIIGYVVGGQGISSTSQGQGFASGHLNDGSPLATTFLTSATEGKYTNTQSSATSGNQAGIRFESGGEVLRVLKARFKCKFRVNRLAGTTASTHFYVGMGTNAVTAFPTGSEPFANASGIALGWRNTDTNYQLITNSGDATSTYTNISGSAKDFNVIHTVEIKAKSDNTGWEMSVDNGSTYSNTNITTDIPASTTAIAPFLVVETATSASRDIEFWYLYAEQVMP